MGFLEFIESATDLGHALEGRYDPFLVALSAGIAVVAAHAALGLASRIRASQSSGAAWSWLSLGATAMGPSAFGPCTSSECWRSNYRWR